MPPPDSAHQTRSTTVSAVTKEDYLSLANFLQGKGGLQRVHKKDPHGEAVREAAQLYGRREFVAAYECFRPAYDKVVADMERVLARNPEFEANKLATKHRIPLSAAKENVRNMKAHAQQVLDQFDKLLHELESKPLVRVHLRKGENDGGVATTPDDIPPDSTPEIENKTRRDSDSDPPTEIVIGDHRYTKAPYAPPEKDAVYSVRDKAKGECIVRVVEKSHDGAHAIVEVMKDGKASNKRVQLSVESLSRQAARGWCSLLQPIVEAIQEEIGPNAASEPVASDASANAAMRLDIQNFGRCCADIVRANIKFDTQLIKDVADGPFRAGRYDQAFLTFEQITVGFTSAVASSRQAIAEGRRRLTAEKGKLSGKEIQERTAAFIRSEQLINTAQREFSTILEGLRMYLRAQG